MFQPLFQLVFVEHGTRRPHRAPGRPMEQTLVRMPDLEQCATPDKSSVRDQLIDLMDPYEQPLYNFLNVMLQNRELALDCVQETFLRAFQHLEKGRPISAGWLWTVARNQAIDQIKEHRRTRSDFQGWDSVPDARIAESDETQAVRRALEGLPPEDREVLYLFIVDRFRAKEIGEMLKIRPEAVRMRITRARQRFRAIYGAEP